jgi:transposase
MRDSPTAHTSVNMWTRRSNRQKEIAKAKGLHRPLDHATAHPLTHDDHVVVEATGNAAAVSEVLAPHVGRVVIANPRQVRLIAEARIKRDTMDATVLARLYASGFLPEAWVPDERTLALRRQVTRRNQIVRQRARLKTMLQSILHAHLVPPCPFADLLGPKGRAWLLRSRCPPTKRTRSHVMCVSTIVSAKTFGPWSANSRVMPSPIPTQSGS